MGRVQIIRWFNYNLTTRSEQLRILEGISSNPALEPRGRVWALGAQIDIDATDEKVVEMLGILTRSRNLDWIVRADAAEMLGSATRGNAAAVEILRSVGEDESENDRVRSNALRSLGRVALVDDDSTRKFLNDSLLPKNANRIQSGAYSGLKQLNPNM